MDATCSSNNHLGKGGTDAIVYFLRQGLEHIQQGRDAEGIALLSLCREELTDEQMQLASILDTFIERCADYRNAWLALQKASLHFSEERKVYESHITLLSTMLPKLLQHIDISLAALPFQQEIANTQSVPTQVLDAHTSVSELPTVPPTNPLVTENVQTSLPGLSITCFGQFTVKRVGQPIPLCPNRKGQNILRYLLAQTGYSATTDALMATFWPEEEPEVVQSKLHIAISALRRSLNQGCQCGPGQGYIICKNRVYSLRSDVIVHSDVDEFVRHFQLGQQISQKRIIAYEHACQFYTGSFLVEDLYADWSFLRREQLSQMYLSMCKVLIEHYLHDERYEDAIKWANAILKEDRCEETAYQHLIHIYMLQGRRSEALQQYQRCERILKEEMGVQPLPETRHAIQMMLLTEHSDKAEI